MEIQALKELIFAQGQEAGFSDMEIGYSSNEKFSCNVYEGQIDDYSLSINGGLAFRGLYQGKMGYAYTEKIDESSIDMLINTARQNAMVIDSDDIEEIFEGSPLYEKLDLYNEELKKITTEEKIKFLKDLEEAAYRADKRVFKVDSCVFEDYYGERMLFNTKGLAKTEKSNLAYFYLSVVVKEQDDIQSSYQVKIIEEFKKLDPEEIAQDLVKEAVAMLGGTSVKSKSYPILMKNKAAAELLKTFSGIFSAENVQKGRSRLNNKLGEAIASPSVSIVDDPLLKGGVASRSFDSEGVASKRVQLVEDGLLKSLLHNLKTAKKDGVESTGHGYKPSYKGTLGIAPSNLYIEAGANRYEDLVASLSEGLIITELQGLHSGADEISGDFSLAANGFYVKEGKIIKPVKQITVAGNFLDLLKDIESIGDDLIFGLPTGSYIGSPTLKIKALAVSGE
ncbi:TldD/PmbA family protein [Alkaliphilus crotonatoxidans]